MFKGKLKIDYDNSLVNIIKLLNFEYHCKVELIIDHSS